VHEINLKNLTSAALLNIADGLVAGGNYSLARQLYGFGAREAPDARMRQRFQSRAGLLVTPTEQTQPLVRMSREIEALDPRAFVGDGLATWMKSTPFLEDPRFVELAHKHAALLPLANWHWALQTVLWAVQETATIEGDLVELGVFRGHTTLFVTEYLEFHTSPKTWWLYDTFEGVPADQLDPGWERLNDEVYAGKFSYEEVRERFAAFPNIEVIKGRVPEVLAERSPERISFMHIDLNNATAEIAALDMLFDRLSPGGMIVFDDYGWANARAQYEAEKRWFASRSQQILLLPTGQGLFVKR
jgi:O-methyltransferase